MIDHILKITGDKGERVDFHIHYTNGRVRRLRENDALPLEATMIIINGTNYETRYTETGKIERFRR